MQKQKNIPCIKSFVHNQESNDLMRAVMALPTKIKKIFDKVKIGKIISILKLAGSLGFSYSILFFIPLISLQFSGHKSKELLAAIGLGISFGNAIGFTFVIGIDLTCQTFCSQANGAKNYRRAGILIQRGIILLCVFSMPLISVWLNAEKILLSFGQNEEICRITGVFLTWYIPVLFTFALFRLLCTYIACQNASNPQVLSGFLACITSIGANYILGIQFNIGFKSYAISTIIAYLVGVLVLIIYIKFFVHDWPGWSLECLEEWWQFMKLFIPGVSRVLLDWGTAEAGVILMGLFGKTTLDAMLASFNITSLLYVIMQGIGTTACLKVGNLIGAGMVKEAKKTAIIIALIGVIATVTSAVILLAIKDYLGYIFSSDKSVIQLVSKITILLAVFNLLDCNGGVACGILTGLGLQRYVAVICLVGYVVIGLPISIIFAFVLEWGLIGFLCLISHWMAFLLAFSDYGYWAGRVIGVFILLLIVWFVILKSDWSTCSELAIKRGKSQTERKDDDLNTIEDRRSLKAEEIPLLNKHKSEECNLYLKRPVNSFISVLGKILFVTCAFAALVIGLILRIFLH